MDQNRSLKNEYELPLSVWGLIEENMRENERLELKGLLGEDLISEASDLRNEISIFMEIHSDLQTTRNAKIRDSNKSATSLPEPPKVRERLIKDILFFYEAIRENVTNDTQKSKDLKSPKTSSPSPSSYLCANSAESTLILENTDNHIINYARESCSRLSSSRPGTASDQDSGFSRHSSLRITSPSVSLQSERSSVGGGLQNSQTRNKFSEKSVNQIGALREKLDYRSFDEIISILREHVKLEINELKHDLDEIQQIVMNSYRDDGDIGIDREPSLFELKQERKKLEETMLHSSRDDAILNNFVITNKSELNKKSNPLPSLESKQKIEKSGKSIDSKRRPDKSTEGVQAKNELKLKTVKTTTDIKNDSSNQKFNSAQRFRQQILKNRQQNS